MKAQFRPGGASLHNNWAAHGPDHDTFERGRTASLQPRKVEDSLVFMGESRMPLQTTSFAMEAPERQRGYQDHWQPFVRRFPG